VSDPTIQIASTGASHISAPVVDGGSVFGGSYGDLLPIWAATKVFLAGGNPYDGRQVLEVCQIYQPGLTISLPVYYPPWSFPLLSPLGWFNFADLIIPWLFTCLMIFIACTSALFICARRSISNVANGGDYSLPFYRSFSLRNLILLASSFAPFYLHLQLGQTTAIVLLGVTLYLLANTLVDRRKDLQLIASILAALGLTLTMLKPHLLVLVYVYAIWQQVVARRWQTLFIWIGLWMTACVIAAVVNPRIMSSFITFSSLHNLQWRNPCLGALLAMTISTQQAWPRYLPLAVAVIGVIVWLFKWSNFIRQATSVDTLRIILVLLPLSILVAPYAWEYDFVLLIVGQAILVATMPKDRWGPNLLLLVGINLTLCLQTGDYFYTVWFPVAQLAISVRHVSMARGS